MSDLTWTDLPEVDPAEPDQLVLDFSGEVHRVSVDEAFVIGRGGDLDIDDNPYLHRRFLVLSHEADLWWIANEGSRLSAVLTDGDGLVQSRLAPGARMPLVFPRVILTFSAGPTTYEIDLITAGEDRFTGIEGARESTGRTTIGVTPMTRSQLLLVLALCEPVLKRAEGAASNRRTALVEHAVSTLMVTAEDLPMLDEEYAANQAAEQESTAPVDGATGEMPAVKA